MKIFLPFKQDLNPYLEEISDQSVHEFVYDSWKNYKTSYSVVNIHWPEAIFDWTEPDEEELEELSKAIDLWKKNSLLVYTKHDFERNKGTTGNFTRLFTLIEEKADILFHLGEYSNKFYEQLYPNIQHYLIYHPLFKKRFKIYDKEEARKRLNISKDALVVIAPGNIRHRSEKNLVLSAFKKLPENKKVLISTNMRNELEFDFPGRVKMQKIFDVQKFSKQRFEARHQSPHYLFTYEPVSNENLSLKMSAADVVLIPRINILNSGIVFLGASFNKVVVGPRTGNITEQLEEQNLPVFDPYSKTSVFKALKRGIDIYKKDSFQWKYLDKYQPQYVAEEYDRVFSELITNEI